MTTDPRSSLITSTRAVLAGDIADFYGEDIPHRAVWNCPHRRVFLQGYSFDFINADGILNHLSVEDGGLVTPSGMHYRLLYLGEQCKNDTPCTEKVTDPG